MTHPIHHPGGHKQAAITPFWIYTPDAFPFPHIRPEKLTLRQKRYRDNGRLLNRLRDGDYYFQNAQCADFPTIIVIMFTSSGVINAITNDVRSSFASSYFASPIPVSAQSTKPADISPSPTLFRNTRIKARPRRPRRRNLIYNRTEDQYARYFRHTL